MATIKQDVQQRIKDSGTVVAARLVEALAERELAKRQDLCLRAFDHIDKLQKDLRKISKPNNTLYIGEAMTPSPAYTEDRKKEIDKLKAEITKYENALNKALDEGDYESLRNLSPGGGEKGQPATTGTDS